MTKPPPLDKSQKSPPSGAQSGAAPKQPGKLIPMTTTSQPATAGKGEPFWRIAWPRSEPGKLAQPDPGLAVMTAADQIASDLAKHLPSDPYLRRLMIRHNANLQEGEGKLAAEELRAIDHYIAEQVLNYARSRRAVEKRRALTISTSAAFAAVAYLPGGKAEAVINFSLTARGHEARQTLRIVL